MARPLWLRLFGAGGAAIEDLRAALIGAPAGDGLGDGRFLARLQAIFDRPAAPAPDQQNADRLSTEHATLATAVVAAQDLVAAPARAPEMATPVADTPEEVRFALFPGGDESHAASLYLNGVAPGLVIGLVPQSPLAHLDPSSPYTVLGDMQSGLVVDNQTKTLMQGGPGDYPALGQGPHDTVVLHGDYAVGFALATPEFIERVVITGDSDFSLVADDSNVGAGATLTIDAVPLTAGHHIAFDGSDETDGSFVLIGSGAADVFLGGAGNDVIWGEGGADVLSGGGGSDTFAYRDAAHSSGAAYDILADFDPAVDKIDLEVGVTGFDTAIQSGTLSAGSFSADLGGALAGLGAGHAVLYTPDAGDLAGKIFLIVDANGIAGYQEGEDYVFALQGTTLADLSAHTGFFI